MKRYITETYAVRHLLEKSVGLKSYSMNVALRALIKNTRPNPFIEYNHQNECIFIHVPRTGGTAVAKALFDRWGQGHIPLYVYRVHSKSKYKKYFKFSFVRNPYDRFVSAFHQAQRDFHKSEWSKKYVKDFDSIRKFARKLGKDKFFRSMVLRTSFFRPQWEYIYVDGNVGTDFLGRFESLHDDFNHVCEKVDINANLKKRNESSHNEYKSYIDDEVESILYKIYQRDFQIFEYERI